MHHRPQLPEIDNHTTKLIVGVIALCLASLTNLLAETRPLESISASYWDTGYWSRNIFVGSLFAIAAFLLSYNGHSKAQMVLSKVAAVAAVCVALFPCGCGDLTRQIVPKIHYFSAAVMFAILAIFCYSFFCRAWPKGTARARLRAVIYALCGIVIVAAIALMLVDKINGGSVSVRYNQFTFRAEACALVAFGVAWLTASRKLPVLTSAEDRVPMFPASNH